MPICNSLIINALYFGNKMDLMESNAPKMKQFYLNTKRSLTMAAAAIVFLNTTLNAQSVPELVFKNPVLVSGVNTGGKDNAIYWFKNVATDIDAKVKIVGRSHSSNVVLNIIDETGTGYDNAFQPKIAFTGGTNYSNNTVTDWYLEFKISFVKSSDTSVSVPVTGFNATALDVDGTGSGNTYLHEAYSFFGLTSYTLETGSTLTASNTTLGNIAGKKFEAGNTEYTGIDVTASKARVTTKYANVSSFTVRIGGKAKGSVDAANGRQYSVWFKGFTYDVPVESPVVLPVKLISFNAKKDSKGNTLDWATSMEKNFSHFVVERSTDGRSFNDAAIIFSEENNSNSVNSYTYTDKSDLQASIIYYRLKMVDIDSKYEYSEVRIIRNASNQDQASITVYPNPAVNELRITVPDSWQNKAVTYSLYNNNGIIVKQKTNNNAGQTEIMNLVGMTPGLYMIKVVKGDETLIKQIIKQN